MFFSCQALSHENCSHGDGSHLNLGSGEMAIAQKAPRSASATKPKQHASQALKIKSKNKKSLNVDIHCHYQNSEVGAMAAPLKPFEREPSIVFANQMTRDVNIDQMKVRAAKLSDIPTRLRDMDKMGIDVQIVSPAPAQYFYYAEPDFGLELSRKTNERIAEIVAMHPDRFAGMCTVPLQHPKMAAKELERCVKKLGMRGVEICTNVNGIDLADKRLGLDVFFAKAQELDVTIFMHPMGFTHADRMTDHYFNNIIGNPLESTLAVSHLIFGGVLDRFPGLKFVVAHGGGYLAHYHARMDHGWKARPDSRTQLKKKPSSYLKKFYYDTITFDSGMLDSLIEKYSVKHVLLGSDYPYDMADDNPLKTIQGVLNLTDDERKLIQGGNAAKLFKLSKR
ncbi:MAG: amidohydrolase family protein [Alcaligenaceae bacterium]